MLENHANVAFICEGGCILFVAIEASAYGCTYETHVAFIEGWRGAYAKAAFAAACRLMFMTTPASAFAIRIPDANRAAKAFFAACGAKKEFSRAKAWPTASGPVGQSYWAIRYDSWIVENPDIGQIGVQFWEAVMDALARAGKAEPAFEQMHMPYFGAFFLMACAGQIDKALALYNRFAIFANMPAFLLVSRSPCVANIGTALVQFADGDFKVIMCN